MENLVNVIVVSDHGMTPISPQQVIFIDDYINMTEVNLVDAGPNLFLIPTQNNEMAVFNALNGAHPNMTVYLKPNIPPIWNYNDSIRYHYLCSCLTYRITPIFGVADLGWSITTRGNYSVTYLY